jgi:hypothetical protein
MADALFKALLPYEEPWCQTMGYFNPYIDGFDVHLTNQMPFFDGACYKRYPRHNFVYDKLWIVKSQGLAGGRLEKLAGKEKKVIYPIFIKPRWGHLSASSKNCFKINSPEELEKYIDYPDMMWAEFINAKEGMTDYVLLKGQIVHQLTYIYSEKQNGFSDDWKYISPESKPPAIITEWVKQHMTEFSGIVNVQYRDDKIIEVGLRLARGGAYVVSTKNRALIQNINDLFIKKEWNYNLTAEMNFTPFYVFKCFTSIPIIYLLPQKIVDWFVKKKTTRTFYEYYFEPTGATGMVFFQFMDDDFERGMQTKKQIEKLFNIAQLIMYALIALTICLVALTKWRYRFIVTVFVLLLWLTRLLNPITANYKLYKAQKQLIFGGGPTESATNEIESFDGSGGTPPVPPQTKQPNAMAK